MIEKAKETLEIERNKAIEKVKAMNGVNIDKYLESKGEMVLIGRPIDQEKLKQAAIEEINDDHGTILEYLGKLKKFDYNINDDLTRIEGASYSKGDLNYNVFTTGIKKHFNRFKVIPLKLKMGLYFPDNAKTKIGWKEI